MKAREVSTVRTCAQAQAAMMFAMLGISLPNFWLGLLMILFFSLREVPRLELPPLPRPTNAGQWPVLAMAAAQGHHDER